MKFWVKTNTSIEYNFEALRFEIHQGIAYFYDKEGSPVWVIKDWVSFGCEEQEAKEALSPDEYYENLNDQSE